MPCSGASTCARSPGRTCRHSCGRPARRRRCRRPGEHDAITVDFAHSSSVVQSVAQLGRPSIGHATAAGKVMLAFGDVELPAEPFTAYTPRTITTRAALVDELERVRERGFADAREEREEGLAAIAAPVWDSSGALAGIIGVQGPASRFDAAATEAAVADLLEHSVGRLHRSSAGRALAAGSQTRQAARSLMRFVHFAYVRRFNRSRSGPTTRRPGARSATSSSSASIGRGLQRRSRSTSTARE